MSTRFKLGGVNLAEAAETVMLERWRELWPYIHVYPPPDAITVHEIGSLADPTLPAVATEVLRYQVQPGLRFIMQAILLAHSSDTIQPGDALWTVTVNADVSTNFQAMAVNGLNAIDIPLGSYLAGNQWPFRRAYEFKGNDVVRAMVSNLSLTGGFFVAGFFGYLIPDLLGETD